MPRKPKTPETEEITPPELFFTYPDHLHRDPLKMTYGLEMDIRRMLPDPETALTLLLGDPFTQDYIVRRCLTDKQKLITDLDDLIPVNEVDLDTDTTDALLMWVGEHALYFFAKRTSGLAKLAVRAQASLPKALLQQSPTGSENSLSETPSAGPSE